MQSLLGPSGALQQIPPANAAKLTGKEFFPQLISQPFHHGLVVVFTAAALMMLIGAIASLFRGGKYVHDDGTLSTRRRRRPDGRGRPGRAAARCGRDPAYPPVLADPARRRHDPAVRRARPADPQSCGARPATAPVSHGVLSALVTLVKEGPLRSGELAAREGMAPPSITKVVAALETGGYVERAADPRTAGPR